MKTKILVSDGSIVERYHFLSEHKAIAFDGVNIWVSNNIVNSISKL